MASQTLKDLVPEVAVRARKVQRICRETAQFDLLIYCTLRPLDEQARLYRQSRGKKEINAKAQDLRKRGYGFLADILEKVGPCLGEHVTNAAPGESWHNYGQAWDAVPLIGGKPVWNYAGPGQKLWDAYGKAVRQSGMHWAGDWTTFREYPHAQLQADGNPLMRLSPVQARKALVARKLLAL